LLLSAQVDFKTFLLLSLLAAMSQRAMQIIIIPALPTDARESSFSFIFYAAAAAAAAVSQKERRIWEIKIII
jgi:hypothetical protein